MRFSGLKEISMSFENFQRISGDPRGFRDASEALRVGVVMLDEFQGVFGGVTGVKSLQKSWRVSERGFKAGGLRRASECFQGGSWRLERSSQSFQLLPPLRRG